MARRLFFVPMVERARAELRGADAHHLTRVLRVEPGQRYEISDNEALYLAEVELARKDRVVFRVIETLDPGGPEASVTLLASLVKFDRFEWIVEKATELGAAAIVPVNAARSEKGLAAGAARRVERWRRIALESSQQCRRRRMPVVCAPEDLAQALRRTAQFRYLLDELPGAPALLSSLPPVEERSAAASVAVLAGPEGGWTDPERSAALGAGWRAVSLGRRILRAETAALAALAVIGAAWQD
jgi:16S rRNA (uracil1498-N3)-methyltransferase